MKIRKIQITRKIEDIIKSYLFHGRYPAFQTITQNFSHWLQENYPGVPIFQPKKVMRKEKSSYEKYNQHVIQIDQDIKDAYQATIQQTNQIMNDFNYLETEKEKILHELYSISKEIDELLLMNENADFQYYDGYTISFEDAKDINQKESNVFVDLTHKEITLPENVKRLKRIPININRVKFNPLLEANKHEALESLQYGFDDNVNTVWWHVVKTKTLHPGNRMVAELIVPFSQIETISHIEYIPHHSKPINAKIEYTRDGSSYQSIQQKGTIDKITGLRVWSFQPVEASGIKFIFEKEDYDEVNLGEYNYYFGAKSIHIYKKHYMQEGIFYSNPISFDSKIQQISIVSKQDVPVHTDLSYEVSLYQPDQSLNEQIWYPIDSINLNNPKNTTIVNLKTREQRKVETSKAEATGEVINGMQVFRLMRDNGSGILSEKIMEKQAITKELFDDFYNPKLFRGINQWKRERTYLPFYGTVPLNSLWNEQEQNRPNQIKTDYLMKGNKLDISGNSNGGNDNFYRFSMSIYSTELRNEPLSLSAITMIESTGRKRIGTFSVYVNRKRLDTINDEVLLPLIKGWNEIQILFHFGNLSERKDIPKEKLPTSLILGKFNFAKEKIVRGDANPLEYVDVNSLYYNIAPNNRNYFSIHERQVVLNYLPTNCIFQFLYDSNQHQNEENQIAIRAHLKRDKQQAHVTPKIYSIQMRVK